MKKLLLAVAASFAFTAAPAHAWLDVEGSWWFMKPSGNVAVGINGIEGTTLDVRIIVGKYVEIGAEFFQFSMSADNIVQRTVNFQNLVFPVDADVSSQLDATFVRGFVRCNVGPDIIHGGVLAGGQYMDFSAKAASPLFGSGEEDAKAGMPYVGAFLESSPVQWLTLRGSICGFHGSYGDISAKFLDTELSVMLNLDWFYAGGGYRYISVTGTDNSYPITADLTLSGPTVFAGVRW